MPQGSPVYAAEDGVVRWTGTTYISEKEAGGYADARKAVVIEHGSGADAFTTSYGHVEYTVRVGQTVKKGDQIGTVANWGKNTHLHYGVRSAPYDELSIRGRVTSNELTQFVDPVAQNLANEMKRLFGGPKITTPSARSTRGDPPRPTTEQAPRYRFGTLLPATEPGNAQLVARENGLTEDTRFGLQFRAPEGWRPRTDDPEGVIYERNGAFIRVGLQTFPGQSPIDVSQKMFHFSQRDGTTKGYTHTTESERLSGAWGTWSGDGKTMEHVIVARGNQLSMVSTSYRDAADRRVFLDVVESLRFASRDSARR